MMQCGIINFQLKMFPTLYSLNDDDTNNVYDPKLHNNFTKGNCDETIVKLLAISDCVKVF